MLRKKIFISSEWLEEFQWNFQETCEIYHRKRTSLLLWKVNFWKNHRRGGSNWHPPTFQDFIQALLLTSVFPEGLSLMAIGYNPTCVKHVGSFSWRFRNKPLQWSRGQALESFGYFSDPRFLNSLSMHHSVT